MREDGFLAGAFSGAVGSVVNSAFLSVGNHHYFKDPVFAWTDYALAALGGAVAGGIANGWVSVKQNNNFWTGKPVAAGGNSFTINNTPKSITKEIQIPAKTIENF